MPPGRRLAVPLQICVLQGLSLVKARLLSMEIPAHVGEDLPKLVHVDNSSSEGTISSNNKMDKLVKIDPFRGSWGLRFLELEFSNPTDVVFDISVSVHLENSSKEDSLCVDQDAIEHGYPKTRIDRDCSARVLIPLEHFKLPILDASFFVKDDQPDGVTSGRSSSFCEKNTKAELNASIKNLISRIKVRWQSGRNSSGELNIKDAIQAALQTSVMDVLLPDPLTFGFRLLGSISKADDLGLFKKSTTQVQSPALKGSVVAHDVTPMEVVVRNNTKDRIRMSLSITCRDVAGENCMEGAKATVLLAGAVPLSHFLQSNFSIFLVFSETSNHFHLFLLFTIPFLNFKTGVLSGIRMEVPPLQEVKHSFSLNFLVPGEYTLVAAAMIDDASDILRARARTDSPDEPILCRGPPYHVRVVGTA